MCIRDRCWVCLGALGNQFGNCNLTVRLWCYCWGSRNRLCDTAGQGNLWGLSPQVVRRSQIELDIGIVHLCMYIRKEMWVVVSNPAKIAHLLTSCLLSQILQVFETHGWLPSWRGCKSSITLLRILGGTAPIWKSQVINTILDIGHTFHTLQTMDTPVFWALTKLCTAVA